MTSGLSQDGWRAVLVISGLVTEIVHEFVSHDIFPSFKELLSFLVLILVSQSSLTHFPFFCAPNKVNTKSAFIHLTNS